MRVSIWHDGGLSDVEGDEDAGECSSSLCFLPTEVEIEAARRDLEEASAADMRQRRDTPDVRDVIPSPTIAEIPQKYPETTDIWAVTCLEVVLAKLQGSICDVT